MLHFQILAFYLDFEGTKNIHVLYVLIWDLEDAGGSWLESGILTLIWFWSLIFGISMLRIFALYLDLKVQRISMFFKSSFWYLEAAGGSWLGFGILNFIWIWSLVFDTPMIQILALYLDFEYAKNILIWGVGGCWRFLTGVWHLDLDLESLKNLAWILPEVFFHSDLWKVR